MTLYIDSLLVQNLLIDYLLLLTAGKLTGEVIKKRRLLLGAALGAIYAGAAALFPAAWLRGAPAFLAVAALMTLAAFWGCRYPLRVLLCMLGLSACLAGAVYALHLTAGDGWILGFNVMFAPAALDAALMAAGLAAVAGTVYAGAAKSAAGGRMCRGSVSAGGRRLELNVLLDTGSALRDPLTNSPVLIIDCRAARELAPPELRQSLSEKRLKEDPAGVMEELSLLSGGSMKLRLLPYRAVGVSGGLLLAIKTDSVSVAGKTIRGALAAFSPTPVSDGDGCQAIIGV